MLTKQCETANIPNAGILHHIIQNPMGKIKLKGPTISSGKQGCKKKWEF
jgi:hypothetical protein